MESEKVKEIKEKLQEEIFIANSFGDKLRKVPTKELENLLTLINELESENAYQKEHIEIWFRKNEEKKKRIAELEKENAKYKQKLTINQWVQEIRKEALKQFAERLIDKKIKLGERFNIYDIDETLKEFIK